VPPLTDGEAPVLSFGALYHPWTVTRAGRNADAPLRRLPPDGAVFGLMAEVALADGAWRAPANRPLRGVLALDPPLGPGSWGRLAGARVNALLNDARGFLALSEETLGGEGGLERVHVRRLMTLLRRIALREGQRFVFEPHGAALRRRVQATFERFLGELFHRGAFAGRDASEAFRVVADATVNPPASVDQGRLVVELRVAPAAALNFLTVRLVTTGPAGLAVEGA
jgi:phage tail sheath protein FI